jgi:phosphoglycerate dehydrogenase-like enzyme
VLRVVVLDDYQNVARSFAPFDKLADDFSVVVLNHHTDDMAALAEADVLVAMRERTRFGAEQFAQLPRLKLLTTTGMANAAIDLEAAAAHGVLVCGTGMTSAPAEPKSSSTTELTWALILAVRRHLPAEDHALRKGQWQTTVGTDLAGSTLGVVGLGRLGTQVARIGQAFDMDVVAWSQNLTTEGAARVGAENVSKEELFARSDVVTIHQKLSDRTVGLVGAAEFAAMKPTAVLVNTSRGPIVDQDALLNALHAGTIGGAGLDVYEQEPLPPHHPLLRAPRTVLTPHLGYVTKGTFETMYEQSVENILAWHAGSPVRLLR